MPEERRMMVFKRGTWNGLKIKIPLGGHILPISSDGERLLWKKAQKNLIKKKISEIINKIIPHRIPVVTKSVWIPWKVLSRVTSRHHWYIVNMIIRVPIIIRFVLNWLNHLIIPDIEQNTPIALIKGQGLKLTKWKGWFDIENNIFIFFLFKKLVDFSRIKGR